MTLPATGTLDLPVPPSLSNMYCTVESTSTTSLYMYMYMYLGTGPCVHVRILPLYILVDLVRYDRKVYKLEII